MVVKKSICRPTGWYFLPLRPTLF